jgi:hypothetical protein
MSITIAPSTSTHAPDKPLRLSFFVSAGDLQFYDPSAPPPEGYPGRTIRSCLWDIEDKFIDQLGQAVFGPAFRRNDSTRSPFLVGGDLGGASWRGVHIIYDNNISKDQLDPEILCFVTSRGLADGELILTVKPLSSERRAEINQGRVEADAIFARMKARASRPARI